MTQRRNDGSWSYGCTLSELEILDRSDAGMAPNAIALELGLPFDHVRGIANKYSGSWAANDKFDAMVVAGSKRLAAAIAATGRDYS